MMSSLRIVLLLAVSFLCLAQTQAQDATARDCKVYHICCDHDVCENNCCDMPDCSEYGWDLAPLPTFIATMICESYFGYECKDQCE